MDKINSETYDDQPETEWSIRTANVYRDDEMSSDGRVLSTNWLVQGHVRADHLEKIYRYTYHYNGYNWGYNGYSYDNRWGRNLHLVDIENFGLVFDNLLTNEPEYTAEKAEAEYGSEFVPILYELENAMAIRFEEIEMAIGFGEDMGYPEGVNVPVFVNARIGIDFE